MTLKFEEALAVGHATAGHAGELVAKYAYLLALEDAQEAANSVRVSPDLAAERTDQGAAERGKAVARRIIQDKLKSLHKGVPRV